LVQTSPARRVESAHHRLSDAVVGTLEGCFPARSDVLDETLTPKASQCDERVSDLGGSSYHHELGNGATRDAGQLEKITLRRRQPRQLGSDERIDVELSRQRTFLIG